MAAKLIAVCVALFLLGGAVQAAGFHAPSTAAVELSVSADEAPADVVVTVEPTLELPVRHGIQIEMPPITQLITYTFAPRMDRPPRN
jgi:hypothetical protein